MVCWERRPFKDSRRAARGDKMGTPKPPAPERRPVRFADCFRVNVRRVPLAAFPRLPAIAMPARSPSCLTKTFPSATSIPRRGPWAASPAWQFGCAVRLHCGTEPQRVTGSTSGPFRAKGIYRGIVTGVSGTATSFNEPSPQRPSSLGRAMGLRTRSSNSERRVAELEAELQQTLPEPAEGRCGVFRPSLESAKIGLGSLGKHHG